jgi:hypothetical protein
MVISHDLSIENAFLLSPYYTSSIVINARLHHEAVPTEFSCYDWVKLSNSERSKF